MIRPDYNSYSDSGILGKRKDVNKRLVSLYTSQLILLQMRDRLGIEAMVTFLEKYARTIERLYPEIRDTVNEELIERSLQKLYQSICNDDK